jgi:flagellar biosynthesis protein FlhF
MMELKTFQARTMADALAMVKGALGREAVILHTRTLRRGGLWGLGARAVVEITATADARVGAIRQRVREDHAASPATRRAREDVVPAPPATDRDRASAPPPDLCREVREIRSMVQDLLTRRAPDSLPDLPAELLEYYTRLIGQHVAAELVHDILLRASRGPAAVPGWDQHGMPLAPPPGRPASLEEELLRCVSELVPPAAPLQLTAVGRPTVAALVGPTGVGKTTTLAKLAANMKLNEGRRVGLITLDTYRIAAVEQLRTYAQILSVPLTSVLTPQEMREAVRGMSDLDLILIDTAGRSQRDQPRIAELGGFLEAARPDQVHLVLSSTSSEQTIRQAIESFCPLGASHVIFTKLDEAVGLGVILNVLQGVDLRLSYLTHGQSVPEDIEAASARRVAQIVLGLPPAPAEAPPAEASRA